MLGYISGFSSDEWEEDESDLSCPCDTKSKSGAGAHLNAKKRPLESPGMMVVVPKKLKQSNVQNNPPTDMSPTEGHVFRTLSQKELIDLPKDLKMVNLVSEPTGDVCFRCEPANKIYPGVTIPDNMMQFPFVFLFMGLLNTTQPINIRIPDLKMPKNFWYLRTDKGIFIDTSKMSSPTIYFKKKSQVKGEDTAFRLGKGYLSHTDDAPPQFSLGAVAFQNGSFIYDSARRTERFYVLSKRQDRFLPPTKKRHKKNTEEARLETNIAAAELTINRTRALRIRLQHRNNIKQRLMASIRHVVSSMPESTAKIALEYAIRPIHQKNEAAEL